MLSECSSTLPPLIASEPFCTVNIELSRNSRLPPLIVTFERPTAEIDAESRTSSEPPPTTNCDEFEIDSTKSSTSSTSPLRISTELPPSIVNTEEPAPTSSSAPITNRFFVK